MVLQEALEKLYARHTFGIKLGLDVELDLLERLGRPERTFASIHVAGTNGKGSVCAMLESVLRASGFRTGLYTSPHLVRINERMRVNGQPIGDEALLALMQELDAHSQAGAAAMGQESTFFEYTTALAFEHFRRSRVQVAVIEVGMGGRLDATNVVEPLASVITGISLEHTQHLGLDIPSIAREKAGIVKKGRPTVCGALPDEALGVVKSVCRERGSPLLVAPERVSVRVLSETLEGQKVSVESGNRSYGTLRLPLAGAHQSWNLAVAIATMEAVEDAGLPVAEDAVRKGIAATAWPGRFQLLEISPPVILDGAHNPEAAGALADALHRLMKKKPVALVAGMCDDKDTTGFFRALGPRIAACWLTSLRTVRGKAPTELAKSAAQAGLSARTADLRDAIEQARCWAAERDGAVCIAGSLYLAGEVLALYEARGCVPDSQ
jgi:dihydrofolate synthase / folylpolyglutamate synthase